MWIRTLLVLSITAQLSAAYDIVRDYSGASFFDGWDFYGSWDNLTNGDVWWLDEVNATSSGLATINSAGNAVIRVDDQSYVPENEKRNSVRITSQEYFNFGSLWIIDMVHMPFGCSVWPAFWTKGPNWPEDGEIDIIEGVNGQIANQYALHTSDGCLHTTPPNQLGVSAGNVNSNGSSSSSSSVGSGGSGGSGDGGTADALDCSSSAGCTVAETKPGSFGSEFAQVGGGVFAAQFDVTGIFIWYFPRDSVPDSIAFSTPSSSVDLSDWGEPSAAYVNNTCLFETFFTPQQLVLDITLCGDWAGEPSVYNETCAGTGPTGVCYNDNVIGSGENYQNAYFEIQYLRAYTTVAPGTAPTAVVGAFEQSSSAEDSYHLVGSRQASALTWAFAVQWSVVLITCAVAGGLVLL